jgi:hypothetical protein
MSRRSIYEVKADISIVDSQHLTYHFKQLLDLTVDKIQFYYEFYRENLYKQYEFCFENGTQFYDILNNLESIIRVSRYAHEKFRPSCPRNLFALRDYH